MVLFSSREEINEVFDTFGEQNAQPAGPVDSDHEVPSPPEHQRATTAPVQEPLPTSHSTPPQRPPPPHVEVSRTGIFLFLT